MDIARLDAAARSLAAPRSRRAALAALGALALGSRATPPASAGRKRHHGGALGCTKADNGFCVSGTAPVTCPNAGTGSSSPPFCVLDLKGRPLCAVNSLQCVACASNRDCAKAGVKGGRCVPCAVPCDSNSTTTACLVPYKP